MYVASARGMKLGRMTIVSFYTICALLVLRGEAKELLEDYSVKNHGITKKDVTEPLKTCTTSIEGELYYATPYAYQTDTLLWICKNREWVLHKLSPTFGLSKSTSGKSCKQIKEQLSSTTVKSGVYWVQEMQVYCDMEEIDGGGWTLVWQHSYMEDLPLNSQMTYFSNYYKPCTTKATGWCNIPNKARFGATEMVICAYHTKKLVYCYASLFNRLIDYDWRGPILSDVDLRKIVDKCTQKNGVQPAPHNSLVVGMTFDKYSPTDYSNNCDTYSGSLNSPGDCRWENCGLPSSISSRSNHVQMTVAIYVR